ncbi:hypothetical protein [Streptomyces sp. NPDC001985]|uniref:hypothetical protein n=1 Tax=Streptomyces sp. NPDC001985 TaxID=3154406 RepID=UPI003326D8BB
MEPLSSWYRRLGRRGLDGKTVRAYAYTSLILVNLLAARGLGLPAATGSDLLDFRLWRREQADETVGQAASDRDAAAIGQLYDCLSSAGKVPGRPWRAAGRGTSLGSGVSQDGRARHLRLEQYLFFRDVGLGGLEPGGEADLSFRGRRPHRNRAAAELALMTGVRGQEWSTLPLPELGLLDARPAGGAKVVLAACAKYGRERTAYVPRDAIGLLTVYLLLERAQVVAAARRTLRRQAQELFLIDRTETDGTRVRGLLEGRRGTLAARDMKPGLRRIAVRETSDGLEPLTVFVGRGGRTLTPSGWDRIRRRAWDRMRSATGPVPLLPRMCWVWHDLRDTFAPRLLILLTREALGDVKDEKVPMASLIKHMAGNPPLVVQRRLGHTPSSTTYRYLHPDMSQITGAGTAFTAYLNPVHAPLSLAVQPVPGRRRSTAWSPNGPQQQRKGGTGFLRYRLRPAKTLVGTTGFEPATP